MVDLRMRRREMSGDGGYHHEKLGHKRYPYLTKFTIPDTVGSTPNETGTFTDTWYFNRII